MCIIKKNIDEIKKKISRSCEKAGVSEEDIVLIAVTKTRRSDEINESINAGIIDIGENKVQEIMDKYNEVLPAKWHMIGHLQTNKVKYIIDKVKMIHSLDSLRLAEEINKRAKQNNLTMDVLIQINVAEEDSKYGIGVSEIDDFLAELERYEHMNVKGFMTVAPFEDNPENVRVYFKQMKQLFDKYKSSQYRNVQLEYLSMGMTNDYEIAIEEGANMIRIGTAIFGARNYIK